MTKKIITISRAFGSGGRSIGKEVAQRLGIPFYDKELVEAVAKESGFHADFIEEAGEYAPVTSSFLFSIAVSPNPMNMMHTMSMADQLFVYQTNVIRSLADKGPCVIVGRCADYILREHKDLLRVFIYAPMEERIRRAVEEYGDKESNMESFVTRKDKQRASYYNYFTSVRWGDRKSYDLCINSALGLDTAVELIRTAALAREGQGK